jgi:hypothetical protein
VVKKHAGKDGLFSVGPLRPYFRAILGVATTLKKLGRHDEALEKYLLLFALDSPNKWCTQPTYMNYRYASYSPLRRPQGPLALCLVHFLIGGVLTACGWGAGPNCRSCSSGSRRRGSRWTSCSESVAPWERRSCRRRAPAW